jgi:thiamine biosynthesis lipoprotein
MKFYQYIFVILLIMVGCTPKPPEVISIQGEVFGSYYIVKYVGDLDRDVLKKELNQFFKNFNDSFSTYQKDSVISVFNMSKANERLIVSKEFIELLKIAQTLFEQTQGAFDPTLGPVIKAWGFGGAKEKKIPSAKELAAARALVGFNYIKWDEKEVSIWKTKDGVQLDVNAFAPGYAADLMAKIFENHKVNNFMIDISGEFVIRGDKGDGHKWVIGIEKPSVNYAEGVQQILTVTNESIATSGDYRQFYNEKGEKLSHIIDPRTGRPVDNGIASASVITSTGALADGWGTAMMILGEEGILLAQKYGVKVFLLKTKSKDQYEEIMTDDFKTHLIQTK